MADAARVHVSNRLWEPTVVLPAQLTPLPAARRCPEIRLVAAMLEDAIHCVLRNSDARRGPRWRDFIEAWDWLLDDGREWPFAFGNVCEILGLDASAVRERLWHLQAAPGCTLAEARRTTVTALESWRQTGRLRPRPLRLENAS